MFGIFRAEVTLIKIQNLVTLSCFLQLKRVIKNVHKIFFFRTPPFLVKPFRCDPQNIFAMIPPCLSIIGSCDTKIQFKGILNMYCSLTVFQKYPAKAETRAYEFSIDIKKFQSVFLEPNLDWLLMNSLSLFKINGVRNYSFCSIMNTFISQCRY